MAGLVRKEARALWLVWAGTAATGLAAAATGQARIVTPGRLALFVGSVALAAMSVGHEYSNRTLPVLLSLPVNRRRIWIAKLLALAPMLAALALLALAIGPGGPYFERGNTIGALSLLSAVCLAPWLTMVSRNPLAGAVFALGLAGMAHLASLGLLAAWLKVGGTLSGSLQALLDRILAGLLITSSTIGVAAGWRTFMRLEAPDGYDAHLSWPRWLRSAMAVDEAGLVRPAARAHPIWLLVKKELRLQQMSLAVAAINVAIWLATYLVVRPSPAAAGVMTMVAMLYGGLLAILIGALASAEERHLGTLEWQTLLPVSAWRQFAVKTIVTLGLSLLLAFVLPILLARGELPVTGLHAATVLLLTVGALFVSSLCDSGLKAMALSAPALFVIAVTLGWTLSITALGPDAAGAVILTLAVIAWWSAFLNHRTARS